MRPKKRARASGGVGSTGWLTIASASSGRTGKKNTVSRSGNVTSKMNIKIKIVEGGVFQIEPLHE